MTAAVVVKLTKKPLKEEVTAIAPWKTKHLKEKNVSNNFRNKYFLKQVFRACYFGKILPKHLLQVLSSDRLQALSCELLLLKV